MRFLKYSIIFFASFLLLETVYSQNTHNFSPELKLNWREVNSSEYEDIFFSSSKLKSKDENALYNESNFSKQYIFVLYYNNKIIYSDPLSKNGSYNIRFNPKAKFCFKSSILKQSELRKIELATDVKLKYDISNQDILCSVNFKLLSFQPDGSITKNDPFFPFLTSKIFELSISDGQDISDIKFNKTKVNDDEVVETILSEDFRKLEEETEKDSQQKKPIWPINED